MSDDPPSKDTTPEEAPVSSDAAVTEPLPPVDASIDAPAMSVVPSTLPSRLSEVPPPPSLAVGDADGSLLARARWLFLIVPIVGIVELLAHAHQLTSVVPDKDWHAAHDLVKAELKPDDLVIFEPAWTDPIGREMFGDEIATLEREAPPDATRFPRAFEVSIRGKHAKELEGWRQIDEKKAGSITIRTLENPSPAKVVTDLVSRVGPTMSVTRNDQPCTWTHASPQTGGLGFGPTVPGNRFQCAEGGFVGVSVVPVLDYTPHRCIFAPPPGGNGVARLTFPSVAFGHALHGHHAIYVEGERFKKGAPVSLTFKVDDRVLGQFVHMDGDGWKPFEVDTSDLAGTSKDLIVEIASAGGNDRRYCFEADTR